MIANTNVLMAIGIWERICAVERSVGLALRTRVEILTIPLFLAKIRGTRVVFAIGAEDPNAPESLQKSYFLVYKILLLSCFIKNYDPTNIFLLLERVT